MKRCIKCKELKEFNEFHKNNRAKDGLHSYCKKCNSVLAMQIANKNKDKINANRRLRRKIDQDYRKKINKRKMEIYWEQKEKHLLCNARQQFKRRGIICTIELQDINIPERCPILDVPFDKGRYSPSIDRIDNSKGYIPGNVWIISKAANTIKNDGSIEELLKFCENLPKYIKNMI